MEVAKEEEEEELDKTHSVLRFMRTEFWGKRTRNSVRMNRKTDCVLSFYLLFIIIIILLRAPLSTQST